MVANTVSLGVTVDSAGALTKLKGVGGAFKTLESDAKTQSARIAGHFDGAGDRIARRFQRKDIKTLGNSIANSITALATGGSLEEVAGAAGLAMGVSLATQFVIAAGEKLAGSAIVQALLPVVIGIGTTIGSALSTAAAVAMAIWPALLVAAIVAGIVYLINNPEVVGKILKFAGEVLDNLGKGLATVGAFLVKIFGDAFNAVLKVVTGIVGSIIGVVQTIIDKTGEALRTLGLLSGGERKVGDLGIGGHGIPGHASGGWVGLHGPEVIRAGEKGPEYINNNAQVRSGGGMGVTIQGVSAAQIADMVDRELYFKLSRASASAGRV